MEEAVTMRWKFRELLQREGVTVYRLSQAVEPKVSRVTLYRWNSSMPESVNLEAVGHALRGLEHITGRQYDIADLLELDSAPEPVDEESRAWLESGLSRLGEFEPYDWEEGEAEEGESVRYVPGEGVLVGDE